MVRLKVYQFYQKLQEFYISIPYGAIKRDMITTAKEIFKEISIPYGAIKSMFLKIFSVILSTFQFLMVRLKGFSLLRLDAAF